MADKDERLKKKGHGCRNCLVTTVILLVVFNVALYFTGNYFTKKYLDVSLMDCFKVMYDLTHSDQKKIVTNGYTDADYTAFEKELKKELFIKEDAHFSLRELMNALLDSNDAKENEEEAALQERQGEELLGLSPARAASVSTDAFVNKLSEFVSRENMDLERLRAYDESNHEDYVMHVSDRMLAAAIGRSVDALGEGISQINNFLKAYSFDSLSSVARVDQITFGKKQGIKDGEAATVRTVKVTVSADARGIAQAFLRQATGKDLKILTKILLPKRFYVTAEVAAEANASVDSVLHLNNMDDKQMARTYKVLDGIMRCTGKDSTASVRERVEKAVNKNVSTALDKAARVFPIAEAENGKVRFDAFETVIDLAKINVGDGGAEKPAEEQLHAPDLIKTLAGVAASDLTDGIKPEYDFSHQYYDSTEDKVVYVKTTPAEGQTWLDYKQLFMEELERKYLLDFTRGTADTEDDITFDDLMKFFGLGEPNGEAKDLELSDLLDGRKLHGLHGEDVMQAEIDSRMLGAILQTQMDSLIPSGGTLSTLSPKLEYVFTYVSKGRNMMEAAFSIDASSLLKGKGSVEKIVSGLLGERALLTLTVDITPKAQGGTCEESQIAYNGLSVEKTNDILKTIRIFVSDFSREKLLEQIVEPVRDVIDKMDRKIPVTLCSSVIDVDATSANLPAAIKLGSVYEVIKEYEFKEDDITADDIKAVLEKLEASDSESHASFETSFVGDGATSRVENGDGTQDYSYEASLDNVLTAYYVKNPQNYTSFDEVFGDEGVVNKENFDAQKFDFNGEQGLFYDAKPTAQMKPKFTQGDLAALILKKMEADDDKSGSLKLYEYLKKVRGAKISQESRISLIMALDTADLMGDAYKGKAHILPSDRVYLTATVYIGDVYYYDQSSGEAADTGTSYYRTVLSLNGMTDAEFGKFKLMIDSLNGKSANQPIDFDIKARDIGAIVYRELHTIEDALGGKLSYGDGYAELPTVYDFIKKSTIPDSDAATEDVREALQGLGAARTDSSAYNYDASLFGVNLVQSEAITLSGAAITDTQTLNDNAFGKALKSGFTVAGVPVGGVLPDTDAYELKQLNALQGAGERDIERRATLNDYNGIMLSDDVTYLEFTFTVHLKKLAPSDSKMMSALPDDAYITLLFEKKTTGTEHCTGYYRLNTLSHDALSLLLDMANIGVGEITAQIARCTTAMAQYGSATFGAPIAPAGTAYGSVSFVPPAA